jgi:hypothetical protein
MFTESSLSAVPRSLRRSLSNLAAVLNARAFSEEAGKTGFFTSDTSGLQAGEISLAVLLWLIEETELHTDEGGLQAVGIC